jgi:hypothetical protein
MQPLGVVLKGIIARSQKSFMYMTMSGTLIIPLSSSTKELIHFLCLFPLFLHFYSFLFRWSTLKCITLITWFVLYLFCIESLFLFMITLSSFCNFLSLCLSFVIYFNHRFLFFDLPPWFSFRDLLYLFSVQSHSFLNIPSQVTSARIVTVFHPHVILINFFWNDKVVVGRRYNQQLLLNKFFIWKLFYPSYLNSTTP